VGFIRGFLAPFRGGFYVARHRLWPYLIGPLLLDLALGVSALYAAQHYLRQEAFVAEPLASNPVFGWLILIGLTLLSGAVIFLVAQPLLLAVFADRLCGRVEKIERGSAPEAPFFASTGQAIVHGLLKLVLYAIALVIGLALTAVTGVGSLVGLGLAAIFLAYDGFDFPLARRGAGFGAKWAYLVRHPVQTLGFGAGATLLYLIPFAFLVAPPFAAVGATLVFLDAEARAGKASGGAGKASGGAGGTTSTPGSGTPEKSAAVAASPPAVEATARAGTTT
jgi:CysZ protein